MMRYVLIIFALLFAVVVTVTILTDPDPMVQTSIQIFEVKDEYDSNWKSSITPINDEHNSSPKVTRKN
jgi:uncharacterized protein involved in exopolysaccharide biosynthesis